MYFRVLSLLSWIIVFLICLCVGLAAWGFSQYQAVDTMKMTVLVQQMQLESCKSTPLTTFPFDPKIR